MEKYLSLAVFILLFSCSKDEDETFDPNEPKLYTLPVVVHVIHSGQAIGDSINISEDRIKEQIESLNNDFRRKTGTLGENNSALSDDSYIQFKLAESDPDGNPTTGITRINFLKNKPNNTDDIQANWLYKLGYWDPENYINIWVYGGFRPKENLGYATLPTADLDGLREEIQVNSDGIMINTHHFGKSTIDTEANLGRTLTHEMGHFLGLLHIWGKEESEHCMDFDDFVEDTSPVTGPIFECDEIPLSCIGEPAPVKNYMNLLKDECMNTFTQGQIKRMRFVLENSPRRKNLMHSNTISR
ncbi:M43 family zinc metalloprotease [Reichenbachiella versicolor]|uniref:M43 family zinc metalloprotease n=1 Tax=Reichenbachiella versicolor TaxID=1821036 RepID=UPI000D6E4979|nr:M43 family zinc metalloprotease [Reichenbachiella versicolor]